jgi:tRNA(fMet)-specific endonuclease VapC
MTEARFLLDTNIVIYIRRRHPEQVITRFERLKAGEAALSVISYGQLLYGAEKSLMRDRAFGQLEELASLLQVLPLPAEAAGIYGAIRADLEVKGQMIGGNDIWIAAHAKARNLTLVTNNEREFKRVAGLRIQNWLE